MSYLRYLCLSVYSGVQHTLWCVFVVFLFVLYTMPVSLDCPLLIAPSVFSNVYLYVWLVSLIMVVLLYSIILFYMQGKDVFL